MKSNTLKYTAVVALSATLFACGNTESRSVADTMDGSDASPTMDYTESEVAMDEVPAIIPGNDNTNEVSVPQSGQITAAEWNDLHEWEFWRNLGQNAEFTDAQKTWRYNLSDRYDVTLTNNKEQALVGATVQLIDSLGAAIWTAQTDNRGKIQLWGNDSKQQPAASIIVEYEGSTQTVSKPVTIAEGVNQIVLNVDRKLPQYLDVQFVVDATGSMSDEIDFLKSELMSVMNRVSAENTDLTLNLGSVFYRDESDTYLTQTSAMSTDIAQTVEFIGAQSADGGGDFPEAVDAGLAEAISNQQWNENAVAKILFLVLDAPPHQDSQSVARMNKLREQAAAKGIRIVPVTASGIDKSTEFLMRSLAMGTNGTYVFITDDSGIGNAHLEATVGKYEVEFLNDLMVRLINGYSRLDGGA